MIVCSEKSNSEIKLKMSRKTVKDLYVELCSLKEEFIEVKTKLETLLKKYEDIEKKCLRILFSGFF